MGNVVQSSNCIDLGTRRLEGCSDWLKVTSGGKKVSFLVKIIASLCKVAYNLCLIHIDVRQKPSQYCNYPPIKIKTVAYS